MNPGKGFLDLIADPNGVVMKFFLRLRFNQVPQFKSSLTWLTLLTFAALTIAGCSASPPTSSQPTDSHSGHSAAAAPTPRIPAFFPNLESAKPLPKVLDPSLFSAPVVAKAYRYAQQNPEIFAQQPCYCYCDSGNGHRSLLDCFATDHSAG